jgi:hypothetical protein
LFCNKNEDQGNYRAFRIWEKLMYENYEKRREVAGESKKKGVKYIKQ